MNELLRCRFMKAVQASDSEAVLPGEEMQTRYEEFLSSAKSFLCGRSYAEVDDEFDNLIVLFDKLLCVKKGGLS